MLRDFSDESKQQLLNLVKEVESENESVFTDWWGDRWYDYEAYIGQLNIGKYLDNVNAYHKKVIDKNNATEKSINKIYKAVEAVNTSYHTYFTELDGVLGEWERYIRDLQDIVDPNKNNFNAKYMGDALSDNLRELDGKSVKYPEKTLGEKFREEFSDEYSVGDLLAGANHIKDIYVLLTGCKDGLSFKDIKDMDKFVNKAIKTYNNYKRIGRAVGKKTSTKWWLKNITGLKIDGRYSTAKKPVDRFINNLTNKTSPFNARFKEVIGDFTGKGGTKAAVASWAGVLLSGITNFNSNIEERDASGGSMSNGRFWAETVTETAIDTVLTYGGGIVVGAAIAAVSPVALPGVAITALTGLVIAGANAGVKALTGKSMTEFTSDLILDGATYIGKKVGSAAKKTTKAVGKWFKGLFN